MDQTLIPMKLITSLLCLSLVTGIGYAPTPDLNFVTDDNKAIELSFFATIDSQVANDYQVYISEDNCSVDTLWIKRSKTVYVTLEANHVYAFRFTKKGYLERLLVVNTYMPADANDLYAFDFEIEMIRNQLRSHNNPWLVFPVAIISYQNESEKFDYNKEYHKFIRKQQGINL